MGQSVRQTARKSALATQAKRRRERAEAERRYSALGVDVAVALTERIVAVERLERAAGTALLKLTRDEGLSLAEACEWADHLPTAEAKRLLRLAEDHRSPGDPRCVTSRVRFELENRPFSTLQRRAKSLPPPRNSDHIDVSEFR